MAKAKLLKKINTRQLRVAQIRDRNLSQTQEQIADILLSEFNIKASRRVIGYDIAALDKRTLHKSAHIVLAQKARLAEFYEMQIKEAMEAWEKSKEEKTLTFEELSATAGDGSKRGKKSKKVESQTGNPAYLAQARAAAVEIGKIYGVEAPIKQEQILYDLSYATDEQLQRIAGGEHPASVMANTSKS